MKTSIWYHKEDKLPEKEGYYLAYKLPTFGDDSEGYGMYYWGGYRQEYLGGYHREWRETVAPHSSSIRVSYWSECPRIEDDYTSDASLPTVAEIDAWNKVQEAINQYNMIRELVR